MCRGMDCAVFFHPHSERGEARAAREATAKALCARCPVRQRCREHALRAREPYGVWGGLSAEDRREVLHPRPDPTPAPPDLTASRATVGPVMR